MASKKKTTQSRKRSRPIEPKKTKLNRTILIPVVIIIVFIAAYSIYIFYGNSTDDNDQQNTGNSIAVIDTSKGIIKIELYEEKAPETCANFIKLANEGFYDGMIFHRISDNFMIQAGMTMQDGSIKQSPYGNIPFEYDSELTHVDGAISMASTGYAVGGSAQFFICDGAQSGLDEGYAVFGVTIEGIDVVRDIADDPHDSSLEPSPGGGKPLEDILINSITIE